MTQTEDASSPELLTTEEVCERLRISRRGLSQLRENPAFPRPARLGHKTLRWSAAELAAWLQAARI